MPRAPAEFLETIHVRLTRIGSDELAGLADDVARSGDRDSLAVFRHTRIGTDLLILVRPVADPNGLAGAASQLGARLTSLLRDHGIADHSVWRRLPAAPSQPSIPRGYPHVRP